MARKLKRQSGAEVVAGLGRLGFERSSTRGSHAKLVREVDGQQQTVMVPLHRQLDKGTAHGVYRRALLFVPAAELDPLFYTD
jgi:predicted RNA binding protein YcfA (HicA-like mRNA interferase family)